jgi:hypothetical protein
MTDEQFVLGILKDGEAHTGQEIMLLSLSRRGHGLTLHSRVASLRDQGWIIASKKVPRTRDFAYWLEGRKEGRALVRKQDAKAVTGYIFRSDADVPHNERICQIISRAEPDAETLEPAFNVRFSNGQEMIAWGSELRPWYPS